MTEKSHRAAVHGLVRNDPYLSAHAVTDVVKDEGKEGTQHSRVRFWPKALERKMPGFRNWAIPGGRGTRKPGKTRRKRTKHGKKEETLELGAASNRPTKKRRERVREGDASPSMTQATAPKPKKKPTRLVRKPRTRPRPVPPAEKLICGKYGWKSGSTQGLKYRTSKRVCERRSNKHRPVPPEEAELME